MDIIWTNILSGRGPRQALMAHIRLYLPFKRSPVALQASNAGHDAGSRGRVAAASRLAPMDETLQREEGRRGPRHWRSCPPRRAAVPAVAGREALCPPVRRCHKPSRLLVEGRRCLNTFVLRVQLASLVCRTVALPKQRSGSSQRRRSSWCSVMGA